MEPRRFAGRAGELEGLERALPRAQSATGSTMLVAGEAGIGKSRLVSELMAGARGRGASVLCGRGIDLIGAEAPFLPLVEALRPLDRRIDWESAPGDRAMARLRLFEALLELLTQLSRSGPVLLVLDDLHWADDSTLDAVAFLARNIAERRIVLVGTYRADEGEPGRSPADLREIAQRAEGNPFYAEELLAASAHDHALPPVLRRAAAARRAAGARLRARASDRRRGRAGSPPTLFISMKTVGTHVSSILHKLDVPTWIEAAAIAHRISAGTRDASEV